MAMNNVLYGNALDNFLNGGDGADQLSGLGGNDTFVFQIDQAQGDSVSTSSRATVAAAGDLLYFVRLRHLRRKAPPSRSRPRPTG